MSVFSDAVFRESEKKGVFFVVQTLNKRSKNQTIYKERGVFV